MKNSLAKPPKWMGRKSAALNTDRALTTHDVSFGKKAVFRWAIIRTLLFKRMISNIRPEKPD
jgi:hypothetical protein